MAAVPREGCDGLRDQRRIAWSGVRVYDCRIQHYLLVVPILAVTAVFYIATMRDGHAWGDDFALYVLHAQNIIEGKRYADTLYVHNPQYPDIGPEAYPPLTAIALAPVYKWFGFDTGAMKVVICTFFLGALWVLFWDYCLQIPPPYAAALVVLVALNPYFWDFKDEIMSDFLFIFFVWTTLYAMQRHYDNRGRIAFLDFPVYAGLVGACMYLTYSARVIGIILMPSIVLYELVRFKRITKFAIVAVLVAGSLTVVQAILLSHVGRGYGQLNALHGRDIEQIVKLLIANATVYVKSFETFLDNGYSKTIKIALFAVVSMLAAFGVRRRLKCGITIIDVFFFLYLSALLITIHSAVFRYLFPVIPIYYLYACLGALELTSLKSGRGWQYVPITVGGAIMLSYVFMYTTIDYGPIREGIAKKESKELFEYIRDHTEQSDIIIFRKPRAFALLTGRRTSIYPRPPYLSGGMEAWDYFHHIGARYFVIGISAWARTAVRLEDIDWERQFVQTCKDRCEEVFSNADFHVYKLKESGNNATIQALQHKHPLSIVH